MPDGRTADFLLLLLFLLGDFLAAFLPAADFFAAGLPVVFLREADFLPDFFPSDLPADFLLDFFAEVAADFFAVFFPAVAFLRATDFFFAVFFAEVFLVDAFFVLNLRLLLALDLPAAFLPADDFRDAAFFLLAPARLGFLLAACFLAGIIHSCRSEKNAELYIG